MLYRGRALAVCCVVAGFAVAGCGAQEGASGGTTSEKTASGGEEVAWGYSGERGPEHWGQLSGEYAACGEGEAQSPVDITDVSGESGTPVEFHYGAVPLDIINTGHTEEVEQGGGNYAQIGGKRYDFAQFHFHSPSEHTVDGEHSAMEMHLVHEGKDGEIAVVAAFIEQGRKNEQFARFWDELPKEAGEEYEGAQIQVNAEELLPQEKEFYEYTGSLTTPPCTEGVKWYIFEEPIELSASQIERFRQVMDHNNRPVQPLNGREIQEDAPQG